MVSTIPAPRASAAHWLLRLIFSRMDFGRSWTTKLRTSTGTVFRVCPLLPFVCSVVWVVPERRDGFPSTNTNVLISVACLCVWLESLLELIPVLVHCPYLHRIW